MVSTQNTSHFQVAVVASGSLAFPFDNHKNIHIQGARDPDAQLGVSMVQNKLELLSTRKMGASCHPFSSSEMKLPTSPFDRLFYATNVQLAIYYDRSCGAPPQPECGNQDYLSIIPIEHIGVSPIVNGSQIAMTVMMGSQSLGTTTSDKLL